MYPGEDGSFVLYEDENDGYAYEKGQYSEIPFTWDEASQTLTIGARKGSFPGMLEVRKFNICKVSTRCGTGDRHAVRYHAVVEYDGTETKVVLAGEDAPLKVEDITGDYIVNPSFEVNGTEGWTVEAPTEWSGVNVGRASRT